MHLYAIELPVLEISLCNDMFFFFLKMSFKPLCHYIIIIKIQKSLTLYQYFLMWPHSNPLFILSSNHHLQ